MQQERRAPEPAELTEATGIAEADRTMITPAAYLEQLQREAQGMGAVKMVTLAEAQKKGRDRDFERSLLESMGITSGRRLTEAEKEFRAAFRDAKRTIPTQLEDFNSHLIMKHLAGQLQKAAKQLKQPLTQMPVYGSLPIGELNAMAIRVPDSNEHLIAFQDGVFAFVNLLAKAVAMSFRVKQILADGEQVIFGWKLRDFRRSWAEDDEPLRRLGEFLQAYLVLGDAHQADHYFIQDPFHLQAFFLREGFELFLFGHELGHVIAGHLGSAPEAPHMLGAMEVEVSTTSNWDMEFEADAIGMSLAIQAMLNHRCDFASSYCGIDMAFSAMEILDLARSTLIHGEPRPAPASEFHPRHAARREFLRRLLRKQLGRRGAKQPIKLAQTMEEVLHQMWSLLEPSFRHLHAQGERPSPIWTPW